MLALGLLFNVAGIGLFCWLIFMLAVLPFFMAINAGIWAFHSGAGLLGTPLVVVAAGGMTPAIAQISFAMTLASDFACRHCGPVRFAGHSCWLSCRPCDGANRGTFACFAGSLRLPWRGVHRRHGVDAF